MEDCVSGTYCKVCQEKYDEINSGQNKRLDALEGAEELAKQGERLDEIEAEPARKWKQAVWIGVSVVITAVVTYFLSHIGVA